MKRETRFFAPAQMPFTINNLDFLRLKLAPFLYIRSGATEPYKYIRYDAIEGSGGLYSTEFLVNNYGQTYQYVTASHELMFQGASATYRFSLSKLGGQITYETSSSGAGIRVQYWLYEDFQVYIHLVLRDIAPRAEHEEHAEVHFPVQVKDQVVHCSSAEALYPAPGKRVSQIVISDTERFSFLTNVNVYFSGCDVYRVPPIGDAMKVDRLGKGRPAVDTWYYLTPEGGYPEGKVALTIQDGFLDGIAVVEFDHDVSREQVTITISLFTSRLCDIRQVRVDPLDFDAPNAICFAL